MTQSDTPVALSDADAATLAEQSLELDLAFLAPRWSIAGYELRQLTVRSWLILSAKRSPLLVSPDRARLSDLAAFVALLSATSDTPEQIAAAILAEDAAGRGVEMWETADEVIRFSMSQAPAPKSDKSSGLDATSTAAAFIDLFASEYGWTPDAVLDLPLAQIWQFHREILLRKHGHKAKAMIMTRDEASVYARMLSEPTPDAHG